ncbi:unnamed protein product [Ixodes pacificus]
MSPTAKHAALSSSSSSPSPSGTRAGGQRRRDRRGGPRRMSFPVSVADCGSTAMGTADSCFIGAGPTARTTTSSGPSAWTIRQNIQTPSGASPLGWPGPFPFMASPSGVESVHYGIFLFILRSWLSF